MITSQDLKNSALDYVRRGLYIHPLLPRQKIPATKCGLNDASDKVHQVTAWWTQNPQFNVGLNCGASDLLALDFDASKSNFAGGDLLARLLSDYPTVTSETGGGGYHLLYRQPDGVQLGNGRGRLPSGVDVRGYGGYVVLPPSIHPNGTPYQLATGKRVGEIEISPLPAFVLEAILAKPHATMDSTPTGIHLNGNGNHSRYAEAALNGEISKLLHAAEGGRNNQLNSAAFALGTLVGAGVLDEEIAEDRLQTAAQAIGLNDREIVKTVQSGLNAGMQNPRTVQSAAFPQNGMKNPTSGRIEVIEDLLSESAGDKTTVMRMLLDRVGTLAEFTRSEYENFCLRIQGMGVTSDWIKRSLNPAVNERRASIGSGSNSTAQATWRDYVRAAEGLGYSFRLNELSDSVEVNGQRMSDVIEAELLSRLHEVGLQNADVARRAITTRAAMDRYHPVREFIDSLEWDGNDSIGRFSTYFRDAHEKITYSDGSERTVFHAWFRRWMIGAVAKIFDPENAQNAMIILDGAQNLGKSYLVKWLCPNRRWHLEGAIRPDDKDHIGYMTQYLVWEVGELGSTIRRADYEALKALITMTHAVYRPPYGRYPIDKPAMASLIGTVNLDGGLLNDPTGHRRFRPVSLVSIDRNYTAIDVKQLWAQAHYLYRTGESYELTTEEKICHSEICAKFEIEDVMETQIRQMFDINHEDDSMFTHTSEIIQKLRTFAGVQGSDKTLQMQCASALTKLKLRKAKRDNMNGWVGISLKTEFQPSSLPAFQPSNHSNHFPGR